MARPAFIVIPLALACGAITPACQRRQEPPPSAAEAAASSIALRDLAGRIILAVSPGERGCGAAGAVAGVAQAEAGGIVLEAGGRTLRLRAEGNRRVVEEDGALRARLAEAGSELHVIEPNGIALVRISGHGDGALIRDRAGVPALELVRDGAAFSVRDPRQGARGSVTGTDDPILAATLAAEAADPALRALLACDQLRSR